MTKRSGFFSARHNCPEQKDKMNGCKNWIIIYQGMQNNLD